MKYSSTIPVILSLMFISCNQEISKEDLSQIGIRPCQSQPGYLSQTGLNPKTAALSTSEKKLKGLVLIEYDPAQPGSATGKTWQAPSWDKFGWMGAIATDEKGNSYIAPAPVVSMLDNPSDQQNTIYKVDTHTAEMIPFARLPRPDSVTGGNPYGLLGLYFDCHARVLYAASVAGSNKKEEKGILYAVDTETGDIIDQLEGIDAMGLSVAGVTGEKRLYAGSAREAAVYSVELNKAGKFIGKPRHEFSLDMMGPRGDDKARRIRFDKNGDMQVWGIEFNYNLTAASEKQETVYLFHFDEQNKKWLLVR
jgi:hypothetical protein